MRKLILAVVVISLIGLFTVTSYAAQIKNYMLVLDVKEYSSEIKDSVNHFFNNVIQKGDQLIVVTPKRIVSYSAKKLQLPKKQLVEELIAVLKTDITKSAVQYLSIMNEMLSIASNVGSGTSAKSQMQSYLRLRKNLETLRADIEPKLLNYGKIFRKVRGENHLIYMMQQEMRPIPDKKSMSALQANPTETGFLANEAFLTDNVEKVPDYKKIVAQFKYGNVRFHFLYMKKKKIRARRGIEYRDNLGEYYSVFAKVSKATNGLRQASAKPMNFVKKVGQIVQGKVEVEVVEEKVE